MFEMLLCEGVYICIYRYSLISTRRGKKKEEHKRNFMAENEADYFPASCHLYEETRASLVFTLVESNFTCCFLFRMYCKEEDELVRKHGVAVAPTLPMPAYGVFGEI